VFIVMRERSRPRLGMAVVRHVMKELTQLPSVQHHVLHVALMQTRLSDLRSVHVSPATRLVVVFVLNVLQETLNPLWLIQHAHLVIVERIRQLSVQHSIRVQRAGRMPTPYWDPHLAFVNRDIGKTETRASRARLVNSNLVQ
jgi:hypothetical protein